MSELLARERTGKAATTADGARSVESIDTINPNTVVLIFPANNKLKMHYNMFKCRAQVTRAAESRITVPCHDYSAGWAPTFICGTNLTVNNVREGTNYCGTGAGQAGRVSLWSSTNKLRIDTTPRNHAYTALEQQQFNKQTVVFQWTRR